MIREDLVVNQATAGRITVHTLGWFCSKTVQKGQKCSIKSSFGAKKCQNDDNFVRRYRFAHAYAHQIQNHLTSSSNIVWPIDIRTSVPNCLQNGIKMSAHFRFKSNVIFWFIEATASFHLCVIGWNNTYFFRKHKIATFLCSIDHLERYRITHEYTHQDHKTSPKEHQNVSKTSPQN